jgi:hypothetical protein
MICTLVFVSMVHNWVAGQGNVLFRLCYYDCNKQKNGMFYDEVYRVNPFYSCPARFYET